MTQCFISVSDCLSLPVFLMLNVEFLLYLNPSHAFALRPIASASLHDTPRTKILHKDEIKHVTDKRIKHFL